MRCENYLQMIDDLVEGELDRQTALQVNSHISGCRHCGFHYEFLKREKEMYELYFEIEPSSKSWTEVHAKLKTAQANNTVKSASKFARLFNGEANIFEHLRLTAALACVVLLLLFGIGFGISKFLSDREVAENASMNGRESEGSQATGTYLVETTDNSQIFQEENGAFKDNSLQTRQRNSQRDISSKRIVLETNVKKSFGKTANTTRQAAFAKGKGFLSEASQLNKKEKVPRFQAGNPESPEEGDFNALPFAGIFDESKVELQIIRVELPRSSLIALGVNLQAENGGENIKTDLLIGSDGIARAIRLHK